MRILPFVQITSTWCNWQVASGNNNGGNGMATAVNTAIGTAFNTGSHHE